MLHFLDPLREVTTLSVCLRLLLAVLCGGLVGIEREHKRRPAGFRTHILICLGAAITTLTSQYLFVVMHFYTDIARLGAQVIAGIGFIGAGAIIVTKRRRVKGLTTAAGLWTSAIVGLACGAGYYEGAILATALILLAELLFVKLEYFIMRNAKETNLYMEYSDAASLKGVILCLRTLGVRINDLEITRAEGDTSHSCAILTLSANRRGGVGEVINQIARTEGVLSVEEL